MPPFVFLCIVLLAPFLSAQIPTDDPVDAQEKWMERIKERQDLVRGAFEVLRFPTGYVFKPRYEHDPKKKKLILNPDFYCSTCAKEKRIPAQKRADARLMDRDAIDVLDWIARATKTDGTYLEDDTFKLYMNLSPFNVKLFPNQFLREELLEIADIFPEVSEKTVELNSHQRTHLYLIRSHRILRDLFWLLSTTNEGLKTKYPYLGPYMGMKGKQEIFVLDSERSFKAFSNEFIGRGAPLGQCWHNFNDRAMSMVMHAQGFADPRVQSHFVHYLMHNLLDAYRMYSFKLPAWFQMGFAAWVERRETVDFNTFCYSEGAIPNVLFDSKWLPKIKKLAFDKDLEPFVSACSKEEYSQLKIEYHLISYSWFCFMLRLGPEKLKVWLDIVKSKLETETLYQIQVKAFREAYGISLLQFEEAWKSWVRATYPDV